VLNLGQGGVGYFNSALGVGGIIGGVLAFGLTGVRRLSPPFLVGVFLWGAPLVMVAVTSSSAAALMLFGVMGFGYALSDVAGFTIIQRSVPDDVLARVFGVIVSVCLGALGIGAAFAPHLTSWLGARHALVSTGVALVVLVGLFALRVTAIDAAAPAPDANELRLLGRVPIFAPLAGATLEQLAGRLVPLVVEPGTEVIRQGDHGDRFYVVAEGELDVAADGKEIASLSAGEYFGEIALLRDVPRTATVTAQTRSVLYALDREDFLSAVTGFAPSAHAAESIVSARLGSSQPADAADVLP
jgi:MFS family permease